MANATRGARPVKDSSIAEYYSEHVFTGTSIDQYVETWRAWLTTSNNKSLSGLDKFTYAHYTQGTSQSFDNFAIRNSKSKTIVTLHGEFQYHQCLGKHFNFTTLTVDELMRASEQDAYALLISAPFSDMGNTHPNFDSIMDLCNKLDIPVCLDLAYWGIAKDVHIDLSLYPAIKEVVCSLSKPFHTLETHRVGIRFAVEYFDDGISMLNEVDMNNCYSMSLGIHYMTRYSSDYMWETYGDKYNTICEKYKLAYCNTVIFGISSADADIQYNRGLPNHHRLCVSQYLTEQD